MKKIEKEIKKYLIERNWHKLRPADLAKSVSIEAAELLELFQWENLTLNEVKNNKNKIKEIEKELADVLIYALDMAVLLEIDTAKIIKEKLDHISKKYPSKIMREATTAEKAGTDSLYWKIKQQYRRSGL